MHYPPEEFSGPSVLSGERKGHLQVPTVTNTNSVPLPNAGYQSVILHSPDSRQDSSQQVSILPNILPEEAFSFPLNTQVATSRNNRPLQKPLTRTDHPPCPQTPHRQSSPRIRGRFAGGPSVVAAALGLLRRKERLMSSGPSRTKFHKTSSLSKALEALPDWLCLVESQFLSRCPNTQTFLPKKTKMLAFLSRVTSDLRTGDVAAPSTTHSIVQHFSPEPDLSSQNQSGLSCGNCSFRLASPSLAFRTNISQKTLKCQDALCPGSLRPLATWPLARQPVVSRPNLRRVVSNFARIFGTQIIVQKVTQKRVCMQIQMHIYHVGKNAPKNGDWDVNRAMCLPPHNLTFFWSSGCMSFTLKYKSVSSASTLMKPKPRSWLTRWVGSSRWKRQIIGRMARVILPVSSVSSVESVIDFYPPSQDSGYTWACISLCSALDMAALSLPRPD